MKTKGALLWEIGSPRSIEEIEVGDPRPGEITVRLAASGLCHSDEHLVTGATPVPLPVIGGHPVKIGWYLASPAASVRGWWENAADPATATKVPVPKSGTRSLDLIVG